MIFLVDSATKPDIKATAQAHRFRRRRFCGYRSAHGGPYLVERSNRQCNATRRSGAELAALVVKADAL